MYPVFSTSSLESSPLDREKYCFKMLLLIVLAPYLTYTRGFYLPGVAPVSFCEDGSGQENCQVNLWCGNTFTKFASV